MTYTDHNGPSVVADGENAPRSALIAESEQSFARSQEVPSIFEEMETYEIEAEHGAEYFSSIGEYFVDFRGGEAAVKKEPDIG